MAIFASTTTSGYSDPLKALTIKALQERQKTQAAQPGEMITPENTQTPMQGMAHVFSQLGDSMAQARTVQALADRQAGFQRDLAGVDWNKGPTSEQIAGFAADPEFLRLAIEKEYERRKTAQTEAGLTSRNDADNANRLATTGMQQEGATARTGMEIRGRHEDTATTTAAHSADVGTQEGGATTRANAANENQVLLHQMDNDVRQAEGEANRAAQTGDLKLKTAADLNLEKIKAGYNLRLAEINNKSAAEISAARNEVDRLNNIETNQTSRENNVTNAQTSIRNTDATNAATLGVAKLRIAGDKEAQQLALDVKMAEGARDRVANSEDTQAKIAAQEKVAAAENALKERLAILAGNAPKTKTGEINADMAKGNITPQEGDLLKQKETQLEPGAVKDLREASSLYRQANTMESDVKTALDFMKGGINEGMAAGLKSGASALTGDLLVDKAQVQRTNDYNNIVNNLATMDMSQVLKGSSTDREMQAFRQVHNDPYASLGRREQALKNLLVAVEADKGIYSQSIKQYHGSVEDIDRTMGRTSTGDPNKPGTATPAKPQGMSDAQLLNEAEGHLKTATPEQAAKINERLRSWGLK